MSTNNRKKSECSLPNRRVHNTRVKEKRVVNFKRRIKEVFIEGSMSNEFGRTTWSLMGSTHKQEEACGVTLVRLGASRLGLASKKVEEITVDQ